MATSLLLATTTPHTSNPAHLHAAAAYFFERTWRTIQGWRRRRDIASHEWYPDVCRSPPSMLLLTHPPPSVHPKHGTIWLSATIRCTHTHTHTAPEPFINSHTNFKIVFKVRRLVWWNLDSQNILRPHTNLYFHPTPRLNQGPNLAPSDSPIYRPFIQRDVWIFMRAPPDLPLNPAPARRVMETALDKSEWDSKAVKGRMRGEVGEVRRGKGGRASP